MDDTTQQFPIDDSMFFQEDDNENYFYQTIENPTIKLFEFLRYATPEISIPEFEKLLQSFITDRNTANFYLMLFIMANALNVFLDGFDPDEFRIFCNKVHEMVDDNMKTSRAPLTKGQYFMIHYVNSLSVNDVIGDSEMASSLYNRFQQTLTELSNTQSTN